MNTSVQYPQHCTHCGTPVQPDDSFCRQCGKLLNRQLSYAMESSALEQERPIRGAWVGYLLVILGATNLTAGAVFLGDIYVVHASPILDFCGRCAAGFFLFEGAVAIIGLLLSPIIIPALIAVGIIGAGVQLGINSSKANQARKRFWN